MSVQAKSNRLNIRNLLAMKGKERVAMLTAYDVMTAHCLDRAGVEVLLVGDSLGNVVYGFESTLPVTMDMTLAHSGAVVRGSERAFVVADLPFMSYQTSLEEGVRNAGLCLAQAGAQGVKLEGASEYIQLLVKRLVETGIPVMGHIGLTPQSVHQMGGFYKHGKNATSAERLKQEARALASAGCFSIVLECVEENVAREISAEVPCLTIGIGSGRVCDGEVLVVNDVLGYTLGKAPSFAEKLANLSEVVEDAARKYVDGVKRS